MEVNEVMKELMSKLHDVSTEELFRMKAVIDEEIQRRAGEDEMVIYQHDCFGCSRYHYSKHKHWAKVVRAVDVTKTNGFAFLGDFLPVDRQSKVKAGSIVVEVCGGSIKAYRVTKDGKEKIAEAGTKKMVEFIEKVAAALK